LANKHFHVAIGFYALCGNCSLLPMLL